MSTSSEIMPAASLPIPESISPVSTESALSSRLTMKDLPDTERPCERFFALGASVLSDAELIAIILRSGNRNQNVLQMAQKLIAEESNGKGLSFLHELSLEELMRHEGIGKVRAVQLKTIIEIGNRAGSAARIPRQSIKTPEDAGRLIEAEMMNLPREELRTILLDVRNRVIRVIRIAEGGLSSSVISPRDLFREAVRANAAALILAHNHPSGDQTPSREDIETTRRFMEMGEMMGVRVVDHLIIARGGMTSLKQQGLI